MEGRTGGGEDGMRGDAGEAERVGERQASKKASIPTFELGSSNAGSYAC